MKKLKIVQSAPLEIEISRKLRYSGIERMIDILNQAYHELGHSSYVAGPGNSDLSGYGKLIETYPQNLWPENGLERQIIRSPEAYHLHHSKCLNLLTSGFADIMHDHPGESIVSSDEYFEVRSDIDIPIVTTIHGDLPSNKPHEKTRWFASQKEGRPNYFVALSKAHKRKYESLGGVKIDKVIPNGIPIENFNYQTDKKDYLLWLGRISDIKGTDIAVQVALNSKKSLIIAGEVHTPYRDLYQRKVEPFITRKVQGETFEDQERKRNEILEEIVSGKSPNEGEILFIGPVNDSQKNILYGNAYCTLMPNRWEEPFGLVLIESMACGTPVIGTNRGAIPEIVKDSKTGFVLPFDSEEGLVSDMVESIKNLKDISPEDCRKHVEENYRKEIMGQNYIKYYMEILFQNKNP